LNAVLLPAPLNCAQDAVRLCDEHGSEFARALINYSSHEVDKVKVGW
jgi:glutamate 5-kinase